MKVGDLQRAQTEGAKRFSGTCEMLVGVADVGVQAVGRRERASAGFRERKTGVLSEKGMLLNEVFWTFKIPHFKYDQVLVNTGANVALAAALWSRGQIQRNQGQSRMGPSC